FWDYLPRRPHGLGARLMVALIVFHAGAALYHQFVMKDGLLRRMWYSR
ncbi:MAG: cytochrome b/b6 domain-containing protein, partial [Pseudomonadota bacterium]